MGNAIPALIQRFIDTTNAGDTEGFLQSFAEDSSLSDWGRTYNGRDEISRWDQSDNIGVDAQLKIADIDLVDGEYHALVIVTGKGFNGPGQMRFSLAGSQIAKLVII